MIFRRIKAHIEKENWFAVGIDFVIVVIGVFIGIQVANWNAARIEAGLKTSVQARLIADFDIIDMELNAAVQRSERQLMDLETLRQSLARGAQNPDDKDAILHALSRGMSYPRFTRRSATYQELQTGGRLDLIDHEPFRVALSQYDENTQQRRLNLRTIRDGMLQIGWKSGQYIDYAKLEQDENGEFQILPTVGYDFEAMLADPEYLDRIEGMIVNQTWIHSNIRWARQDANDVLAVIAEAEKQ